MTRRAFALPAVAAVVGVLLAIGISVLVRTSDQNRHRSPTAEPLDPTEDLVQADVDLAALERHMADAINDVGEIPIENRALPPSATIPESSGKTVFVRGERAMELDDSVKARIEARRPSGEGER